MMDATFTSVLRLWEQRLSQKEISRRLDISEQKVRRILLTAGAIETDESRLYDRGMPVADIAAKLGKSEKAVIQRLPYSKGMYGAEYPSLNALKIRQCRRTCKVIQSPQNAVWTL